MGILILKGYQDKVLGVRESGGAIYNVVYQIDGKLKRRSVSISPSDTFPTLLLNEVNFLHNYSHIHAVRQGRFALIAAKRRELIHLLEPSKVKSRKKRVAQFIEVRREYETKLRSLKEVEAKFKDLISRID